MRLRICPACYKAFYISFDEGRIICPHCGYIFSERRNKSRVRKELELKFYIEGSEVKAKTTDFSEEGAGIIYSGSSIDVNTVLKVCIESLNMERTARAVWAKKVSRSMVSAGLRLL